MKQEIKPIGFILRGIKTEQFAIIDTNFKEGEPANAGFEIKYAASIDERVIIPIVKFTFDQNKVPFLILEVSCHFEIEEAGFASIHNAYLKQIQIPLDFAMHITMLTVGTARGVLHAKTESTVFSQFIIPTINLTEIVREDVVISYQPKISNP